MSIIEKLYGSTGGKPVDPKPGDGGYYNSFGYWQDVQDGNGPPPGSGGGEDA